jgi:isopenicillin-N epimerase
VPAAIEFQAEHDWPAVRAQCHALLQQALQRIAQLTRLELPYADDSFYCQMGVAPLPALQDRPAFKAQLYDQYRIEVPCLEWAGRPYLRVSVQGYNTQSDGDALLHALQALLPQHRLA